MNSLRSGDPSTLVIFGRDDKNVPEKIYSTSQHLRIMDAPRTSPSLHPGEEPVNCEFIRCPAHSAHYQDGEGDNVINDENVIRSEGCIVKGSDRLSMSMLCFSC